VLQFQSRGTLCATSPWGGFAPPGADSDAGVGMGLAGAVTACGVVLDVSLLAWLFVRLRQSLNSEKQWPHDRTGDPRGLYFAFSSSGTSNAECESQKMLPQRRQWCRRVK
jgi:hypothetical protein